MNLKKSLAKFCIMKKVRDKANETDDELNNFSILINNPKEYLHFYIMYCIFQIQKLLMQKLPMELKEKYLFYVP